jgi:hypothetical protein
MQVYAGWLLRRLTRTIWLLQYPDTRAPTLRYLIDHSLYPLVIRGRVLVDRRRPIVVPRRMTLPGGEPR